MKARYAYAVLAVLSLLVGAAAVLWSAHDVAVNDKKWCSLVGTLDQADQTTRKPPAAGTFTAEFVSEIHALKGELGCA